MNATRNGSTHLANLTLPWTTSRDAARRPPQKLSAYRGPLAPALKLGWRKPVKGPPRAQRVPPPWHPAFPNPWHPNHPRNPWNPNNPNSPWNPYNPLNPNSPRNPNNPNRPLHPHHPAWRR